ncbi:tyrosine-type recombinase/integrase [Nocardia sp. CC201C]|uniref:tyrosine-type recombinase/integrase n=1 Tax=Nocardia sp. CC201C TaxID=3044575 RepID=UPI0024A90EB6|nr:tyrosine-type recombinase/integrase [Nocardia sp. CC201C]
MKGSGSVYRRQDGRWEAAAFLPTASGTSRRIRVYARTAKDASDKLTIKLADAERGIPVPEKSWTVGAYLDYWMHDVAPGKLRPSTMELYEAAIRIHLKPLVGADPLDRLSVATLQQRLNDQLTQGKTIRTVQLMRTILSAALTRAMREELVARNVARLVELEAAQRADITLWAPNEAGRFLRYAQSHPLYPAFLMMTLYGIRRGEMLGLGWQDIDWDHNVIRIRRQLQQIAGHLEIGPVKTRAGRRDLPLLPIVRDALNRHQAGLPATRAGDGAEPPDGASAVTTIRKRTGISGSRGEAVPLTDEEIADMIVLGKNGRPLWPRNFARAFHLLCRKAGVRRIKLHHLRHGAATLLKNLGVPPRDVQLILGHAHISTTQQIYQHGDPEGQKTALDRAGRVLLCQPVTVADGAISRQNKPSTAEIVVMNTSLTPGGTGGARTHDTLLKSVARLTKDHSLTPIISQIRTRTSTYILGSLAVRTAVKNDDYFMDMNLVLWQWIPLRTALTPIVIPFIDRHARRRQ